MEHWIEHVAEPRKLFLAWQAPDRLKNRFRWAVGLLEPVGYECQLRYLCDGTEFESLNQGRTYEQLVGLGYQGYPVFSLNRKVHRQGVIAAFMRRLPPRSRPDFEDYKRQFRLAPHLDLSDFALLGQTQAKLPSDGFSLVDPLNPETIQCDLVLEVAGFRYYAEDAPGLQATQAIVIKPEPENPYDPKAVQVCAGDVKIGYINRLQTAAFLEWLSHRRVSAVLERLNGKSEQPRAFIFVRVRAAQGSRRCLTGQPAPPSSLDRRGRMSGNCLPQFHDQILAGNFGRT
jgi:hypothetical protein